MVFIGDENGEFLEVLLTIGKDDLLSVNDLIKQHKTNIYIETIGRGYQCIKYTCKSWSYDVSYQSSPGCTAIVGKPCEIFSLMKKRLLLLYVNQEFGQRVILVLIKFVLVIMKRLMCVIYEESKCV